jgi:hypothetical protein
MELVLLQIHTGNFGSTERLIGHEVKYGLYLEGRETEQLYPGS